MSGNQEPSPRTQTSVRSGVGVCSVSSLTAMRSDTLEGADSDWLPSAADCSVCSGVESGINAPPIMKSTTDKTHTPTDAARLGKRAHVGQMSPTTAHTNTATDAVT